MNSYWRRKFAWSNSRQKTWDECKKQYYFNYIAKWEGLPGDLGRDRLYKLSELQKLAFLKGSLIHESIKQQINNHKANRPVNSEIAKAFFLQELNMAKINKEKTITECANGFDVSDEDFEGIEKDGFKQIDNFCKSIWPNYTGIECLGNELADMFSIDGINIRIRCDFLAKHNENFIVTDWKTGIEGYDDINESVQISAYILWVHKKYNVPLEKIVGEIVYLKTGTTNVTKKTQKEIEDLIGLINEGSKEMLSVSSESGFPASPSTNKCKGCNFLALCKEGQSMFKNSEN